MSLKNKTIKWLLKNAALSLKGKTILITGANSGVGYKTAETCIFLGANVIMACRNKEKAKEAMDRLIHEYPQANISIAELDIANFSSIESFVQKIKDDKTDIDVFVNNAGVFHQPNRTTKDGFEYVIGVNYLGTYYLTEKILPYLLKLSHNVVYINTISLIHKFAKKIDYNDFYYNKKYRNLAVYTRSKLCLAKYTYAIAKKHENSNVKIYMNHPGIAITPLGLNAFGKKVARLSMVFKNLFNSPEKSALSVAYILSHDFPAGSIVGPNKLFGGWGYPKINHIRKKVKTGVEELINFTQQQIISRNIINDKLDKN
ncbi:MAG: SDR family NAD(P)-dependent oxidoreductase [Clostridia bacterium]|nr:SDR family NAD(P)-dependent oxidoreductase [Clostridia bacterium]